MRCPTFSALQPAVFTRPFLADPVLHERGGRQGPQAGVAVALVAEDGDVLKEIARRRVSSRAAHAMHRLDSAVCLRCLVPVAQPLLKPAQRAGSTADAADLIGSLGGLLLELGRIPGWDRFTSFFISWCRTCYGRIGRGNPWGSSNEKPASRRVSTATAVPVKPVLQTGS